MALIKGGHYTQKDLGYVAFFELWPNYTRTLKTCQADQHHVVIGAFLHDIGHLIGLENKMEAMGIHGSLGIKNHEKVGEHFLRGLGFPKSVTDFVRGHVDAKRYLVFK